MKAPEPRVVLFVNFEYISQLYLVFLLLTLNKCWTAYKFDISVVLKLIL